MNKEQAIDLLDNLIGMIEDNQGNDYDTAFRMAIEALKAQLSLEGTTSDQPVATDTNVGDKISKFIDGLEEIFADLRERHVDDSVCGLCEYDGAYMGQSGDWCNECPGFDRDDCFKLSDKTRKEWTEEIITICKHVGNNSEIPNSSDCISRQAAVDATDTNVSDTISRQQAIDAIHNLYAIHGSEGSWIDQKDAFKALNSLPSAQPERSIAEWQKGFREYINMLNIPRDDYKGIMEYINDVPPIQLELTDEQAIVHLQSSGWMYRHDKEIYESGLKEQLADDSDSYDSLLPTIHPELDLETLIRTIETGITATNSNDAYSLGMRNGMRWCKSLIDGVEPKFEGAKD